MPPRTALPQALGDDLTPGFNVVGYLHAVNGIAEGSRLLLAALELTGVPFVTVDYAASPSQTGEDIARRASGDPIHDTTLLCINADMTPQFVGDAGPEILLNRYTIGTWAWETEEFPPVLLGALDFVDEVWMPSDYSRDALRRVTTKPVYTFGHPIVEPQVPAGATRRDLGLPEGFVFSFCFDYFSVAKRKNPLGLIQAFTSAFADGEGPSLLIKTINAEHRPDEARALEEAARGRSDIQVVDRYLTAADKNALIGLSDCYVSLHRAEGFGLTMAEAMAMGRPVIATGYSGNLDFMTEENSYLVAWQPTLVGVDAAVYPATGRWAEPDLDDAARLMRHVFEHQEEAATRGRRAREDILRTHAPAAQAGFLARRFDELREEGRLIRNSGDRWAYANAMQRAAVALSRGPEVDMATTSGGPYREVARAYRRLLRRVLRNSWVHQRDVGNALLDAIRELDARRQKEAAQTSRQLAQMEETLARLESKLEESLRKPSGV
ncbi:MAG TPA: glycosyltransferase [Candidatus Dormibacteraeota bacterium]|jgi:glycosyltransferase involved in cell wall biosynthesis